MICRLLNRMIEICQVMSRLLLIHMLEVGVCLSIYNPIQVGGRSFNISVSSTFEL